MNDYELFIKINDAILLEFDVFKPWEKTMLLSAQNQMMDKYPLSEEQIQLLNNVLNKKRPKKRRKNKAILSYIVWLLILMTSLWLD